MSGWGQKPPLVLQAESAECGLACLAMICQGHGRAETLTELRRRFPVNLTGTNLKDLMAVADAIGFSTRAVKCELDELQRLETPCILHWDLDHYVVLRKVGQKYTDVLDPARGLRRLPLSEVSKHFTGIALELTPAPNFERRKTAEKVKISDLWTRLSGFTPILVQLFCLTLVLQVFGLIMPISNQIVIDDVIARADRSLLVSVMVGFGLIAVVQTALSLLRSYIQLHVSQKLSLQFSGNLLKHMLRLPADFFERRHVGDIVSRFGSLGPIQDFLTSGAIGGVMDLLLIVPIGIVMFVYSPTLSLLIMLDIIIVIVIQAVSFGRNKRFADESIMLSAKVQSIFLETIRAVRAIKLAGRETERHAIWQNGVTQQQNLNFRQAGFNLWGSSGYALLTTAQGLAMLYFGAEQVMAGTMSLGMLMAFQSYALQFSGRAKSIIGQVFTYQMLGLHLERLGDIVHADQELGLEAASISSRSLSGTLEIRNLDFRYSPQSPWVLKGVNIRVAPGDRVSLVGPSGGGKSTLLKLLSGLYSPLEGYILLDGVPLHALGLKRYRDQIGVVMQDDQLLSGTIADNVAFFDARIDMEQVEDVCRLALIHDDIMRLPMAYHSLIGDMGSVLSGGQKQRVLLARALYRRPRILFMDEGTANLDTDLEMRILENLRTLEITHIMVAHRQAAIDFADKIYSVAECQVKQIERSTLLPQGSVEGLA